jgi:hypothetical protein
MSRYKSKKLLKMKKLESVKSKMFVLKNSKIVIGGGQMNDTMEVVYVNGKKVTKHINDGM